MKALTPWPEPASGLVTTITITVSAIEPLMMKILLPFSAHSSPSRRALHSIAAASEPAPGSVIAIAPTQLARGEPG